MLSLRITLRKTLRKSVVKVCGLFYTALIVLVFRACFWWKSLVFHYNLHTFINWFSTNEFRSLPLSIGRFYTVST